MNYQKPSYEMEILNAEDIMGASVSIDQDGDNTNAGMDGDGLFDNVKNAMGLND